MERVPVRIKSHNKVVQIARDQAERFVKANPKEYEIISPPKIEVLKLEPIVEKKSAAVAVEDKQITEQPAVNEPEKRKGGRPKSKP